MKTHLFKWTKLDLAEHHASGGGAAVVHLPRGIDLQILGNHSSAVHTGNYPEQYLVFIKDHDVLSDALGMCNVVATIIMPHYPRQHVKVTPAQWCVIQDYLIPELSDDDLY